MRLMQQNVDGIRSAHEAARATLGDEVAVLIADPGDALALVILANHGMGAAHAPSAPSRQPIVLRTVRREDALRSVEHTDALATLALRTWSRDTGRILVMCVAAGGINVSELEWTPAIPAAEGNRIREEIIQQSEYEIRRARETEAKMSGRTDIVVLLADVRDSTGRAVALALGETEASIEAAMTSSRANGRHPVLIVGMPRDRAAGGMRESRPHVAAHLEAWSPKRGVFPAICFAGDGDTVAMLVDVALPPVGSA